jgi:hypothetical protein
MAIIILKNNESFTPYQFYQRFLGDVAGYYPNDTPIEFKLTEGDDYTAATDKYAIDATTLPLLLCIAEHLKKYHKNPLKLNLFDNIATKSVLEFLYKGDFFNIVGINDNPNFPRGRNLFDFDSGYLGGFEGKTYRTEHKLRAYSSNDLLWWTKETTYKQCLDSFGNDEDKRDFLIGEYSYQARRHFRELLFETKNISENTNLFIDILSELIANGIMHSESDVYAMMFKNRFGTKFSIADNGIGLQLSLEKKEDVKENYYKKNDLLNMLNSIEIPVYLPDEIKKNLLIIFETLYYSLIKKRVGLFDLTANVVSANGYFRLHTDRVQLIISKRMRNDIEKLQELRHKIRDAYYKDDFKLQELSKQAKEVFKQFYKNTLNKYNEDVKYSAVRFFSVKFKGVHIEVEIPNNQ